MELHTKKSHLKISMVEPTCDAYVYGSGVCGGGGGGGPIRYIIFSVGTLVMISKLWMIILVSNLFTLIEKTK